MRGCLAALVFAASLAAFLAIGPSSPQGGDTVPNRYLAAGLICGDWTLNRYGALWGRESVSTGHFPYYATKAVTGDLISTFGPAVPLLSAPAFLVAQKLGLVPDTRGILYISRVLAGLLCAAGVMFVFLAASRVAGSGPAAAASLAFALGSGVLTVASRGLWQHTWAIPLIAAMTWALIVGVQSGSVRHIAFCGLLAGLAFACRPQAALFLVAAAVVVIIRRKNAFLAFAMAAFPVIACVAAWNSWFLDSPFAFAQTVRSGDVAMYKSGTASLLSDRPWEGLAGLLASPSRGLMVLSPALAVGFAGGATLAARDSGDANRFPLTALSMAAVGLFLLAAAWFDWWGGYTVSYRPVLESLPVLAVLTAWALDRWRGRLFRIAWAAALVWSVVLSIMTAMLPGAVMWNEEADVDHHPERIWDIRDSMPIRILEMRESDRLPLMDSYPVSLEGCEVRGHDPQSWKTTE